LCTYLLEIAGRIGDTALVSTVIKYVCVMNLTPDPSSRVA